MCASFYAATYSSLRVEALISFGLPTALPACRCYYSTCVASGSITTSHRGVLISFMGPTESGNLLIYCCAASLRVLFSLYPPCPYGRTSTQRVGSLTQMKSAFFFLIFIRKGLQLLLLLRALKHSKSCVCGEHQGAKKKKKSFSLISSRKACLNVCRSQLVSICRAFHVLITLVFLFAWRSSIKRQSGHLFGVSMWSESGGDDLRLLQLANTCACGV